MSDRQDLLFRVTSELVPASRLWQRVVDTHLDNYGISRACIGPLLMVGRSGGGLRQVDLAQILGMEGPSLVRLLDKLCESGLVRRECDAADRRANRVWVTEAGAALLERLEVALAELRDEVFAGFDQHDLETVLRFYEVLVAAAAR